MLAEEVEGTAQMSRERLLLVVEACAWVMLLACYWVVLGR